MTNTSTKATLQRTALSALLVAAALATGYLAGRFAPEPIVEAPAAQERSEAPSTASVLEQQEQLSALGYTAGSEPAPARSGVTVQTIAAAYASYNVFTSGHFSGALLMAMDGKILHSWEYTFEKLWPGKDPEDHDVSYWRRVHVFDDGSILAVIEPIGIFKLDRDSNLIWKNDCGAHHDFYVADNGHIFTLAREARPMTFVVGVERPILEDYVLELDENGKELHRVSIVDAFNASEFRPLLYDAPTHWDITHTNSLKFLGPNTSTRVSAFQPGRFLLSLRELDSVAVLDFDQGRIEWAIKGMWHRQHEATALENGNILLFNNRSSEDESRVLEVDPTSQQIVWSYGAAPGQDLHSVICGLAKRLPNGNTLITESMPGRVIEVAPDGSIVWEFISPYRAKQGVDVIAAIFDFQRLPNDFSTGWLSLSVEAADSKISVPK